MGFTPVDFKSLIEIVEPTRNRVNINNRLANRTMKLVADSGKI
jgi:hypothetical protein